MKNPTLTVVIPAYDERDTLRECVERLLKTDLRVPVEAIVVDDASTDGSAETVMDLAAAGRIRLIQHRRNRGKGAAVRTGLSVARGEVFTILDADLEYDPADFDALLEPILNGETRVSYGTRVFGAHTVFSFWYVLGNRFLTFCASALFDTWLSDVHTCFKMAGTQVWRSLDLVSDGFEIDAEATAKFLRAGHRIFEVPITYRARGREEGKKVGLMDGLRSLRVLMQVRLGLI